MTEDDDTGPDIGAITDAEFITGWRRIVGEPPAAMLDDRREMIALLVASVAAARWPLRPATEASRDQSARRTGARRPNDPGRAATSG
jgi:hypothetical protein